MHIDLDHSQLSKIFVNVPLLHIVYLCVFIYIYLCIIVYMCNF